MRECTMCGEPKADHTDKEYDQCFEKLETSQEIIYTLRRHLDFISYSNVKAIAKILKTAKKKGLK